MKITVFTPTYNRASTLEGLYKSLCEQTFSPFEWLIVDDGSADNTGELVRSFIAGGRLEIRYIRQENGGKHSAVNRGVREARGKLFFIVDSDDSLVPNALERVWYHYGAVAGDGGFAGVSGCRYVPSGERLGGPLDFTTLDASLIDLRYRYKIRGDLAEVYKTEVLKGYPFPEIPGEKFVSEKIVWFKIALRYRLRFFNENIYRCEYLPGGLTYSSRKNRMKSPRLSMLLYRDLYRLPLPWKARIAAALNYWRFSFNASLPWAEKIAPMVSALPLLPGGFVCHLLDRLAVGRRQRRL
jgi:glycosyltransferase involved in cell wall biosynthesis